MDVDAPIARLAEVAPLVRMASRQADDYVTAAYEAHHREVYSFLARTLRDDGEAEDLLQETFLRLSREVRANRVPDQLRGWLFQVAANLATSRFRRRGVVRRWLDRFGASETETPIAPSPEAQMLGRERFAEMEEVLRRLPEASRTALLLAAEGFSGAEIARAIGRSENATRTLLCRARQHIREELEGPEARER